MLNLILLLLLHSHSVVYTNPLPVTQLESFEPTRLKSHLVLTPHTDLQGATLTFGNALDNSGMDHGFMKLHVGSETATFAMVHPVQIDHRTLDPVNLVHNAGLDKKFDLVFVDLTPDPESCRKLYRVDIYDRPANLNHPKSSLHFEALETDDCR